MIETTVAAQTCQREGSTEDHKEENTAEKTVKCSPVLPTSPQQSRSSCSPSSNCSRSLDSPGLLAEHSGPSPSEMMSFPQPLSMFPFMFQSSQFQMGHHPLDRSFLSAGPSMEPFQLASQSLLLHQQLLLAQHLKQPPSSYSLPPHHSLFSHLRHRPYPSPGLPSTTVTPLNLCNREATPSGSCSSMISPLSDRQAPSIRDQITHMEQMVHRLPPREVPSSSDELWCLLCQRLSPQNCMILRQNFPKWNKSENSIKTNLDCC